MTERALSALQAIDAGCDRESWIKAGMAAKAAGLSLEDFTSWSETAPNFSGARDCAQVWRSFTDGPVKAGTLFSMAAAAGWQDPTQGRQNAPGQRQNAKPKPSPARAQQAPQTRMLLTCGTVAYLQRLQSLTYTARKASRTACGYIRPVRRRWLSVGRMSRAIWWFHAGVMDTCRRCNSSRRVKAKNFFYPKPKQVMDFLPWGR